MSYPVWLPGAIARAGAVLLIAASAALGTYYAYGWGGHIAPFVAYAFAAMALGGEIIKPFAVKRAFAAGWRQPVFLVACLVFVAIAVAYSFTAELAFSAGARGDLVAERQAAITAAADAKAAAKRASDELAGLKPARAVAELEAVIAGAREHCRIIVSPQGRSTVCSKPAALLAELGRAQRRAQLETAIAKAGTAKGSAVGEADPQAAAVVAYLTAIGVTVAGDQVATWLHLLPVLLLEIGSAFGLLVAGGLAPDARTSNRRWATVAWIARVGAWVAGTATVAKPATVARPETVAAVAARRRAPQLLPDSHEDSQQLLAVLRATPGLSNDELADALGIHKGTASKRVKALGPMVRKVRVGRQVALSLAAVH